MRNKQPGTDNIPMELHKEGVQPLITILHTRIKGIGVEEKVHTDWKTNILFLIHTNKGDKLQCHSLRGISLLCKGRKILNAVTNNNLKIIPVL